MAGLVKWPEYPFSKEVGPMHSRESQPLLFKDIINPTTIKDRNQNQNIIFNRNINKSAQLKLFSYNRSRSNSLNATARTLG